MNPWDKPKRTKPYDSSELVCEIGQRTIKSCNWSRCTKKSWPAVFDCDYCGSRNEELDIKECGVLQEKQPKQEIVAMYCGYCFGDIISFLVLQKYRLQLSCTYFFLFHSYICIYLHTFTYTCLHACKHIDTYIQKKI